MTTPTQPKQPLVDHDDLRVLATIVGAAMAGSVVLILLAFMVGLAVRVFLFASGL